MIRRNFQRYISTAAIAVTVMAGGVATTTAAHAQTVTATFGSVNIDQVVAESKQRQSDIRELQGMIENLRRVSGQLVERGGTLLTEPEMRELAGLYEKSDKATDAEKKRIAALETSADQRRGELARLEGTAQPTDAQNRRLRELSGMKQQGEQSVGGLNRDFEKRLQTREEELTTKTLAQIKEAITTVAKAKNLSVVFDTKAALYTANDVTADVIKQVNK